MSDKQKQGEPVGEIVITLNGFVDRVRYLPEALDRLRELQEGAYRLYLAPQPEREAIGEGIRTIHNMVTPETFDDDPDLVAKIWTITTRLRAILDQENTNARNGLS